MTTSTLPTWHCRYMVNEFIRPNVVRYESLLSWTIRKDYSCPKCPEGVGVSDPGIWVSCKLPADLATNMERWFPRLKIGSKRAPKRLLFNTRRHKYIRAIIRNPKSIWQPHQLYIIIIFFPDVLIFQRFYHNCFSSAQIAQFLSSNYYYKNGKDGRLQTL